MSLQFLHQRGLTGNETSGLKAERKKMKISDQAPCFTLAKRSRNSYKAIPVTGILAR
jgi:hypothetical protein